MRALYKYPQWAYPYEQLIQGNRRSRERPEYELLDTGVFDENRYFDILVEYAKVAPDDILIRITATNRDPALAPLHLLPTLWFRNTGPGVASRRGPRFDWWPPLSFRRVTLR